MPGTVLDTENIANILALVLYLSTCERRVGRVTDNNKITGKRPSVVCRC